MQAQNYRMRIVTMPEQAGAVFVGSFKALSATFKTLKAYAPKGASLREVFINYHMKKKIK